MLPPSVTGALASVPWVGPRVLVRLHDRGHGFDVVTWPEFAAAVARSRPREVSVDVFDTCLMRDLSGHRAIEEAVTHRSSWPTGSTESARCHAADLERELCRPVPGAGEALSAIRSVVGSITFVSDTDRSSELLIELLRGHGIFADGDRLFASCEEQATKSDGDLFTIIWPEAERDDVWHVGNERWADGVMAAAAGLRPFHLVAGDLDRYEAIMATSVHVDGAAVAGAARRARLDIATDERERSLSHSAARARLVGVGVGGQALSGFNLWLADQARSYGLTSLGYLARDGELPLRMARAMPADHWSGVALRYLHCSRSSWALASASAVGVDTWLKAGQADDGAFLLTQLHDVPVATLLARIGLGVEDLTSFGRTHSSLARRPVDEPLPVSARSEWSALLDDERAAETIEDRSRDRRQLLIDYLAAEQMLTGRVGLVDVGWRGRLAWHISTIMGSAGAADPVHLHFGGDKIIAEVDQAITIARFAFTGRASADDVPLREMISSPVACVETLTASGKPRVVDYQRRDDGTIELIFSPATIDSGSDDGDRADLWAGALAVAGNLPSRAQLTTWGGGEGNLGADVRRLLGQWWNQPANGEVEAIAHLRFEHDEAGSSYHPLATPYSWREVVRGSGLRRAWVRGSEVMTPRFIRFAVSTGRRLKEFGDTGRRPGSGS